MCATFAAKPKPEMDGNVHFVVAVGDSTVPVVVCRNRTVEVREMPTAEAAAAAANAVAAFVERNPVATHHLLQRAGAAAAQCGHPPPTGRVLSVGRRDGSLEVWTRVEEREILVVISPTLSAWWPNDTTPTLQDGDTWEDDGDDRHWFAYDLALDHMLHHTEQIREMGFDMSRLVAERCPDPEPNDS